MLHVGLDVAGRSVVRSVRGVAPIALRVVGDGRRPRVAIVQTAAMLVAGDDVRLHVVVGAGATLELRDVSATLAHPVADAAATIRQRVLIDVGPGARIDYREQPLVLARRTRLRRTCTLRLAADAWALHRDTVVLGRDGEDPGDAQLRLRVERDGTPVVDETLDTGDPAVLRSPAVLGDAGAVGGLGCYGAALHDAPEDAFILGPVDTLVRRPVASTRDLRDLDALAARAALTAVPAAPSRRPGRA